MATVSAEDDAITAVKFQNALASLNVLISICGSYFGQGEEYDAFNKALMIEAAQVEDQDDEGDEDDGAYDDEEGYDEGEESYEDVDPKYVEATNHISSTGEWQTVSIVRAVPVPSQDPQFRELEEGEEMETEEVEEPSGKKSRV